MELHFRNKIEGPEAEMVEDFIRNGMTFLEGNLEYAIFTEAFAEAGIPDVLIITWEKEHLKKWPPKRNKLTKTDIKITHHVASFKKRGILKSQLFKQLGFKEKDVEKSISNLLDAELVETDDKRVFIKNLKVNFFIRQIITVEAKMKNWKDALLQAQLNENFSSHSYVLLPEKLINKQMQSFSSSSIGIFSHDGEKIIMKKKARKTKLPASYFSWIINEYVGREVFSTY